MAEAFPKFTTHSYDGTAENPANCGACSGCNADDTSLITDCGGGCGACGGCGGEATQEPESFVARSSGGACAGGGGCNALPDDI